MAKVPLTAKDGGIIAKLGAPWSGMIDTKKQSGLVFYFHNDFIRGIYSWSDSDVFPTYEWFAKELESGHSYSYTVDLIAVDSMTGLTDARSDYLLDVKPVDEDGRLTATWTFSALNDNAHRAALHMKLTEADSGRLVAEKEYDMAAVKHGNAVFEAPGQKNLLLTCRITLDGKTYPESQIPLTREKTASRFEQKPVYDAPVGKKLIAGWKHIDTQVYVKPTSAEKKRGFVLYEETVKQIARPLQSIDVDLGIDEFESLPINVYPLLDDVVSVRQTQSNGPKIEIRIQEDMPKTTKTWKNNVIWKKLLEQHSVKTLKDKPQAVWLTIDSRGLKSGNYSEKLNFSSSKGDGTLTVNIKIWPVRKTKRRFFSGEAEHLVNYLCKNKNMDGWDIEKGRTFVRDLVAHNINFAQWCAAWRSGANGGLRYDFKYIKMSGSDQSLLDAIKENPEKFKGDNLPELDLSYWNPVLFMVIEEGMTRLDVMASYVPAYFKDFHAVTKMIYGEETGSESQEHNRIRKWLWSEISRFFEEMGFRERFAKIDDETPHDKFPIWKQAGDELKSVGFKTLMTTSNPLIESEKWSRSINPSLDWWQIGSVNPKNIEARLNAGDIDADDLLWSYTGVGTMWQSYENMREMCGIRQAYAGISGLHIHEYFRSAQNSAIIFYTSDGPVGSPAWEGARDGYDDAEYYLQAKALIETLPQKEQSYYKKQLGEVAGMNGESILKFAYQQNGSQGMQLRLKNPDTKAFRKAKKVLLKTIRELELKTTLPGRLSFAGMDIEDWTFVAGNGVSIKDLESLRTYIKGTLGKEIEIVKESEIEMEQRKKDSYILFGGSEQSNWVKELNVLTKGHPAKEWYLINRINQAGGARILLMGANDPLGMSRAFIAFKNFLYCNHKKKRDDVIEIINQSNAPQVQFAEEELKRLLKQALGGNLSALSVRLEEVSGNDYCTVTVNTEQREVVIRGRSPNAVRDGVFDFVEKVIGVRWLYPGKDGEFVPELDRLNLTTSEWTLPEPMPYRGLHICSGKWHYDPEVAEWMSHRRCNRKLTHHREVDFVGEDLKRLGLAPDTTTHSFSFIIPDGEFYEAHPEYFSLVGGKRIRHADGGQLCLSNANLRRKFIEQLTVFAETHPEVRILGIPPNDGYGWCECENCLSMDAEAGSEPGDVSGRVWAFSIEVANTFKERFPDLLIGQYVYSNFKNCPVDKLPDNMAVIYTTMTRCFKHSLGNPACELNVQNCKELLAWAKRCEHVYLYEYYSRSSWGDLPFPVWHTTSEDMKWCQQNNIDGFLTEVVGADNDWWQSGHLALSATLATLANPDMDVDEFLDDTCVARFGPAAKPMRQYLCILKDAVNDLPGCFMAGGASKLQLLLNEKVRRMCKEELNLAEVALDNAGAFHRKQFNQEQKLFAKWCRIAELQKEYQSPGSLTAQAFPGWEEALAPNDDQGMAVLTERSYRIPSEEAETRLRVYADEQNVYFALECLEPDMTSLRVETTEDNLRVYSDDSIEIFTATRPDATECAHFLANAAGFNAASWCDIPEKRWNWSWPTNWEAKSRLGKDRWTLVARIPRKDIGTDGDFYFTVVRNRRSGARNEMSGFPKGGAFFRPKEYCRLRLVSPAGD